MQKYWKCRRDRREDRRDKEDEARMREWPNYRKGSKGPGETIIVGIATMSQE